MNGHDRKLVVARNSLELVKSAGETRQGNRTNLVEII